MAREFTLAYRLWRKAFFLLLSMTIVLMAALLGLAVYAKVIIIGLVFILAYLYHSQSQHDVLAPVSLTLCSNGLWRYKFLNKKENLYRLLSMERHWYGYYLLFTSSKGSINLAVPYFQIAGAQRSAFARAIKRSGNKTQGALNPIE